MTDPLIKELEKIVNPDPKFLEKHLGLMLKDFPILLHGSRSDIEIGSNLLLNVAGKVYATDNPAIAILKAIFSNRNSPLSYDWKRNAQPPLQLRIKNCNANTIGEQGWVYLVPKTQKFLRDQRYSWQYVANCEIPVIAKLIVRKEDFTYPVFNDDTNERIIL